MIRMFFIFSVILSAFSACQKSTAENTQAQPQSIVSQTPNEDILIRKIDFENIDLDFTKDDEWLKTIWPFGRFSNLRSEANHLGVEDASLSRTPALSPKERENGGPAVRSSSTPGFVAMREALLPLPKGKGEGWGEGEACELQPQISEDCRNGHN